MEVLKKDAKEAPPAESPEEIVKVRSSVTTPHDFHIEIQAQARRLPPEDQNSGGPGFDPPKVLRSYPKLTFVGLVYFQVGS